ncbi:sigma-70 family RNA polymerase sigma factor [Roseiconus lacunae]|uniref:Sigma-70 family RNA polymerase sigma factor n=2 Tax=Roseiconus lacunae TaxID=2605694 RepID=A0ABT7PRP8_9BACT|nr:sigma-70 family RNA polymerase sigma factor [Roseiconus lacunae]MDM4019013.1 sigma-70 family RNA polymerase sigma factor [Roseiconus lacunae]
MVDDSEQHDIRSRLQTGGQDVFAELFSSHRGRLKKLLLHHVDARLRTRTDLSDILQEAYMDAFRRIEHFLRKPDLSFYVWLRQITLQRLIDNHRAHLLAEKRSLKTEVSLSQSAYSSQTSRAWALQLIEAQLSPSQVVMHDEMVGRVERALESMDDTDREVLMLRHFEELKNNEVAEVLSLSPAAASNRYVRALKRLRDVVLSRSETQ